MSRRRKGRQLAGGGRRRRTPQDCPQPAAELGDRRKVGWRHADEQAAKQARARARHRCARCSLLQRVCGCCSGRTCCRVSRCRVWVVAGPFCKRGESGTRAPACDQAARLSWSCCRYAQRAICAPARSLRIAQAAVLRGLPAALTAPQFVLASAPPVSGSLWLGVEGQGAGRAAKTLRAMRLLGGSPAPGVSQALLFALLAHSDADAQVSRAQQQRALPPPPPPPPQPVAACAELSARPFLPLLVLAPGPGHRAAALGGHLQSVRGPSRSRSGSAGSPGS